MRIDKYFITQTVPEIGPLSDLLKIDNTTLFQLFKAYVSIDVEKRGWVTLQQVLSYFRIHPEYQFGVRVFLFADPLLGGGQGSLSTSTVGAAVAGVGLGDVSAALGGDKPTYVENDGTGITFRTFFTLTWHFLSLHPSIMLKFCFDCFGSDNGYGEFEKEDVDEVTLQRQLSVITGGGVGGDGSSDGTPTPTPVTSASNAIGAGSGGGSKEKKKQQRLDSVATPTPSTTSYIKSLSPLQRAQTLRSCPTTLDRATMDALFRLLHDAEITPPKLLDNPTYEVQSFSFPDPNGSLDPSTPPRMLTVNVHVCVLATLQKRPSAYYKFFEPVFLLQSRMRKRISGATGGLLWDGIASYRKDKYASLDDNSYSCARSYFDILATEAAERERRQEIELKASDLAKKEADRLKREKEEREAEAARLRAQRELEERIRLSSPTQVAMEQAWKTLDDVCEEVNEMRFGRWEVDKHKFERLRVHETYEAAVEATRHHFSQMLESSLALASTSDAEAQFMSELDTIEGIAANEQRLLEILETVVRDRYKLEKKSNKLPDVPPVEDRVAVMKVRKRVCKLATQEERVQAENEAKEIRVAELAEKRKGVFIKEHEEGEKQRHKDHEKRKLRFVMDVGSKETKWERVLDESGKVFIYVNTTTGDVISGRTAICEKCDNQLEAQDPRCFNCGNDRHFKNKLLYRPITGL